MAMDLKNLKFLTIHSIIVQWNWKQNLYWISFKSSTHPAWRIYAKIEHSTIVRSLPLYYYSKVHRCPLILDYGLWTGWQDYISYSGSVCVTTIRIHRNKNFWENEFTPENQRTQKNSICGSQQKWAFSIRFIESFLKFHRSGLILLFLNVLNQCEW